MSWRVVMVAFLSSRLVGVGFKVIVFDFVFVGTEAPAMPTVAAGVTVAVGVPALGHSLPPYFSLRACSVSSSPFRRASAHS
jgi:hypothetical protein